MQESAFHEMHHFGFSVLTGLGFESKHTLVQQKFRSGALKSGPYTASGLLPLNFQKQNCFWFCIVFNSCDTSQWLKTSDRSGIWTHAHIRVPEISSE